MTDEIFTEDDLHYFKTMRHQSDLAEETLSQSYNDLAEQHACWVALLDGTVLAKASSVSALGRKLDEKGLDRETIVIRYLPPRNARLAYGS